MPTEHEADDTDEWLSAAETIRLVTLAAPSDPPQITIATRANSGLLRTRAQLLRAGEKLKFNADVPIDFWWATGHAALTQNWGVGDFSTYIGQTYFVEAFGVTFHRGDLASMIPASFEAQSEEVSQTEARIVRGRRMSDRWPEWVAELVLYFHEAGIPDGVGSEGADPLIDAIVNRLADRGLEPPSRTTVQKTAKAVLRRFREAGK